MIHANDDRATFLLMLTSRELAVLQRIVLERAERASEREEHDDGPLQDVIAKSLSPYQLEDWPRPRRA